MKRRHTHQKDLILSAIEGPGCHRTADEVLAEVQKTDRGIGLATVYRNLNLFVQEGRIQKISGEGWSYYDGNPKPHDHLHCRCCGRIFDYRAPYDAAMDRAAEEFTGGKIEFHSTTYEGICKDCLMKEYPEGSKEKN